MPLNATHKQEADTEMNIALLLYSRQFLLSYENIHK